MLRYPRDPCPELLNESLTHYTSGGASISSLSAEWLTAPHIIQNSSNIRVNAVGSGVIETPLFGKLGLGAADAQQLTQILLQQIPTKRFASRRKSPQRWHF